MKQDTSILGLLALGALALAVLALLLLSSCHETYVDASKSAIHVHLNVQP